MKDSIEELRLGVRWLSESIETHIKGSRCKNGCAYFIAILLLFAAYMWGGRNGRDYFFELMQALFSSGRHMSILFYFACWAGMLCMRKNKIVVWIIWNMTHLYLRSFSAILMKKIKCLPDMLCLFFFIPNWMLLGVSFWAAM